MVIFVNSLMLTCMFRVLIIFKYNWCWLTVSKKMCNVLVYFLELTSLKKSWCQQICKENWWDKSGRSMRDWQPVTLTTPYIMPMCSIMVRQIITFTMRLCFGNALVCPSVCIHHNSKSNEQIFMTFFYLGWACSKEKAVTFWERSCGYKKNPKFLEMHPGWVLCSMSAF